MAARGKDRIAFREVRGADGTITLSARFIAPFKEDGQIVWRRVERSTRTADIAKARKIAEAYKSEAYERAYSSAPKPVARRTFVEATRTYIKTTGKKRFLKRIVDEIGDVPLTEIDSEFVNDLSHRLYPGSSAAHRNRAVYTPIIAILRMAENNEYRPPRIIRPEGYLPPTNFQKPPKDWWPRLLEVAPPHLAALMLFYRLHGRRTSEGIRIRPADIDTETWRVTVRDTKTKQVILLRLAEPIIEKLNQYDWRQLTYAFGFSSKSKLYPALKAACAAAGIPYHVPKDAGRHSFASGHLEEGRSLKWVKEAGRWKSIRVPAEIYGHLEHNTVDDEARASGEKWLRQLGEKGEIVAPDFGAKAGKAK